MPNNSAISWFEIPAIDLPRAQKFYETIFNFKMTGMDLQQIQMRLFPIADLANGVGGSICTSGGFHSPSETKGPLIYLNANPDVQLVLDRIEGAGDKILVPKTQISPEFGFMAVFIDSEGNRIALHSI